MSAVRFVVAALIWALTWILPVTFMIVMSWACESDARRFGQRVVTRHGEEGEDIAIAMDSAGLKAGGKRALTVVAVQADSDCTLGPTCGASGSTVEGELAAGGNRCGIAPVTPWLPAFAS